MQMSKKIMKKLTRLHHKGRNKHHYEYWIDYPAKGGDGSLIGMEMPVNYVIEMFCDRVAARRYIIKISIQMQIL